MRMEPELAFHANKHMRVLSLQVLQTDGFASGTSNLQAKCIL